MQGDIEDIYGLSPLQEGMLFHTLYEPGSSVYFEQAIQPVYGFLDPEIFSAAWADLIRRHSILRTSFHWQDLERPLQVVHPEVAFEVDYRDWSREVSSRGETLFAAYLVADRKQGFEFERAPLVRVMLARLSDEENRFVCSFHHILLDGWSYQMLSDELWTIYQARLDGRPSELGPSRPYGEYIEWLGRQDIARAEVFWREALAGFDSPTVTTEGPEPASRGEVEFGSHAVVLSAAVSGALGSLARGRRLTLNTIVQGAWSLLVSLYSATSDVVFGGVVSGRPADLEGVESMIGLFINTLPVRVRINRDAALLPWLDQLQNRQFATREYEYTPMLQIQRWMALPPGTALFDSIVVFENFPVTASGEEAGWAHPDAESDPSSLHYPERTNYPLCLMVLPENRIRLYLYFHRSRIRASTVSAMMNQLESILTEIATDPERRLREFVRVRQRDRRVQLSVWNPPLRASPLSEGSLVGLFARQVAHRPEAPAFILGENRLTYAALDRAASRLARRLRSRGVGPETVVGVCLERSLDTPVALLAVWKARGAYLPLDPGLPPRRLSLMARLADASLVVTRRPLDGLWSEGPATILLEDEEESRGHSVPLAAGIADPADLAYVVFTSGSTGEPKGVAVEHRQVLNRLSWMWRDYPFSDGEVGCFKTAVGFVDSLWELLGGMLGGVPTAIVPEPDSREPSALVDQLGRYGVTRIWLVPAMLSELLNTHRELQRRLPRLRFWVSTGEPLGVDLWQRFYKSLPASVLYNLYGTSEVWDATWYRPPEEAASSYGAWQVPIGAPIDNVRAYVLSPDLDLLPAGAPGELYIGGLGLGRGYIGRGDLTAERFVPDPFDAPGARMYRTGDLVRYRHDGVLEYLRRVDEQIKIRGFRVEPREIESVLEALPEVRRAAVATDTRDGLGTRLVAYLVVEPGSALEAGGSRFRRYLGERLPAHMVPTLYVPLESLPRTSSGKIDRRRLPVPAPLREQPADGAAADTVEERLTGIWEDILVLEGVGRNDDFFEMGGHSLLAVRVVSQVREVFAIELPLRAIFENPTVRTLAEVVREAGRDAGHAATPSITPAARDPYRLDTAPGSGPQPEDGSRYS